MTLRALLAYALPLTLGACSGSSSDDSTKRKMADNLIACQNERSSLKEQLALAQAELKKVKDEANPTVKLDPLELRGSNPGEKHLEGNLPPAAVMKVFKSNQGGLKACYDKGLKRNPNLQYVTELRAHFAVKNSGNAINVGFAPHADGEMEKCMSSTIEKWRFPSFSGDPVQFEYPVSLVAK